MGSKLIWNSSRRSCFFNETWSDFFVVYIVHILLYLQSKEIIRENNVAFSVVPYNGFIAMAIPMDCLMIRASSTATSVRRQHIGRRFSLRFSIPKPYKPLTLNPKP